jgi:cyclic-di-GMP-binding biofilm dispersal mediator protein
MATPRDLTGAVVAVIGGAGGGLGRPIADELRARGAVVVTTGRTSGDVHLDLRDADAGDRLVEHVRATHGRLDGVVDAAGIVAFGDLADTDDVVVEELFLTNVMGPLWLARRVTPMLAESGGFLAVVSAVVAETPLPGMAAYSAAKAALSAAVTALRRELRRAGVTVIDARPPHTETGLATRPLAGTAPRLPQGLDPTDVARRIVDAIAAGETDLPSTAFGH